jgi:hypothetical protein
LERPRLVEERKGDTGQISSAGGSYLSIGMLSADKGPVWSTLLCIVEFLVGSSGWQEESSLDRMAPDVQTKAEWRNGVQVILGFQPSRSSQTILAVDLATKLPVCSGVEGQVP